MRAVIDWFRGTSDKDDLRQGSNYQYYRGYESSVSRTTGYAPLPPGDQDTSVFYEDIRNRRRRRSSPDFVGQLSQLALRDVDPESGAYDYADHVDRRRKKLKRTKSHSTPTHSSQTSERRSSQTTSVATDATPSSLAMDRLQAVEAERDKLATEINQVQVLAQRRSNEQVRELHRLSKEVQHWRWEREQLAGSLNLSHERTDRLAELNSTLVKEVEELQRQKHDLERSLAEARSFAATIDVADLAQAITKLKDLNQLVDDIAFSIFSDLPDEVIQSHKASRKVTKPLRDLLASELVAGYALVGHVDRLGQSKDSSKIEDWLIPLLKTIIYEYLSLHIFSRFHPSIANSTVNEALHSIMSNLQQTDTQARAARWRVMTFASFTSASLSGESHTISLLTPLLNFLTSLSTSLGAPSPSSELAASLTTLLVNSLSFHSLLFEGYLTVDLSLINPSTFGAWEVSFDSTTMRSEDGDKDRGPGKLVVGTSGMGLMQRKTSGGVAGGGRERKREEQVLLQASVLTDKWLRK